jgi:glutamate racemase
MDGRPIGIFDSGIGGLTVVREVRRRLPAESLVYFGDTARVPYGTKSPRVVYDFAFQDTRFLIGQDVKMVVVACHTVSSIALASLQEAFSLPILGVVEPGVEAALAATRNGCIGVIGTRATVLSGAYERSFSAKRPGVSVFMQACPLFVPLVEEGWLEGDVTGRVAELYLEPLIAKGVDTLVLGCTHYPLLKPVLQKVMGGSIVLIDSAEETSRTVAEKLAGDGIGSGSGPAAEPRFFVSDIPHHFKRVGELCLGESMREVMQVDLEAGESQAKKNLHNL